MAASRARPPELRDWIELRVGGTFAQMAAGINARRINSGKSWVNGQDRGLSKG